MICVLVFVLLSRSSELRSPSLCREGIAVFSMTDCNLICPLISFFFYFVRLFFLYQPVWICCYSRLSAPAFELLFYYLYHLACSFGCYCLVSLVCKNTSTIKIRKLLLNEQNAHVPVHLRSSCCPPLFRLAMQWKFDQLDSIFPRLHTSRAIGLELFSPLFLE